MLSAGRIAVSAALATALAAAAGGCLSHPLPVVPVPALGPSEDAAVRTALAAAANPGSSVSIPPRPCPQHTTRTEPDGKCRPIPCGGPCRPGQRCDDSGIVARCVDG